MSSKPVSETFELRCPFHGGTCENICCMAWHIDNDNEDADVATGYCELIEKQNRNEMNKGGSI